MCRKPSKQLRLKYRGWINLIILFALLISGGCSRVKLLRYDDPLSDHSFVTDEPCDAPCWYGLELDQSNLQEIIATLSELSFVDANSVYTYTRAWRDDNNATGIHFRCLHPAVENCGTLVVSGDRFKFLGIIVGFPLTLETVVSKLGPPDYIYCDGIIDTRGYVLTLYWPEQNMEVRSRNLGVDNIYRDVKVGKKISPDLLVTEINYMVQDGFGTLVEQFPWPGFYAP